MPKQKEFEGADEMAGMMEDDENASITGEAKQHAFDTLMSALTKLNTAKPTRKQKVETYVNKRK